jgi:hypothetical protein
VKTKARIAPSTSAAAMLMKKLETVTVAAEVVYRLEKMESSTENTPVL